MADRAKEVYFAKLAEQAERYDEMLQHMERVGKMPGEPSVEERNLLSVAFKNSVGSRRAAWRIINSVMQKEMSKGKEEKAKNANEYCIKIERELQSICDAAIELLDSNLICNATAGESQVFYRKMKADYYRYITEFQEGDKKTQAAQNAQLAYEDANEKAENLLAVADPIRLGLALNYSVFLYEVLQKNDEACKVATSSFEKAIAQLDGIGDGMYKDSTLIMQLLRDNITLWLSEAEENDKA